MSDLIRFKITSEAEARLVKALQAAYAGEMAAYFAYDGHWKSAKDQAEKIGILNIQTDELRHVMTIRKYLKMMGSHPARIRTFIFVCIGKTLSNLCFVTGRRLPAYVAKKIETLGMKGYEEMALLAGDAERSNMALHFQYMAKVEKAHEAYFEEVLYGSF